MKEEMLVVIPVVVALIVICYLLGYFGSYAMPGRTEDMQITFTYASGMRNISLGMVLATSYFRPRHPFRSCWALCFNSRRQRSFTHCSTEDGHGR